MREARFTDDIDSVLELLLESSLVQERELLLPSFSMRAVGGRNRSLLVTSASACFLVKSLDSIELAQREAEGVELLMRSSDAAFQAPVLRILKETLVVTETPLGLNSLAPIASRTRYSFRLLQRLGRALASLHAIASSPDTPLTEHLPLPLDGAPLSALEDSPAVRTILSELYDDELLMAGLASLVDPPVDYMTSIHGDIRAANVLVSGQSRSTSTPFFIDWETSGRGDPMIDVGAAVSQVLALSIQASTCGPDRRGTRGLLEAYRSSGGPLDLARAIRRAGASLIQQAMERAANSSEVPSSSRAALNIARIAILTPESLAVQLRLVT